MTVYWCKTVQAKEVINVDHKEIVEKLEKALEEAYKIESDMRAHNVARAYSYLEARVEQIIEELEVED